MLIETNRFRQSYRNAGGWWKTMRFPAEEAGLGAASPTWDTTNLGYTFANAPPSNQEIQFISEVPYDWIIGTTVYPHIHWTLTVAGAATEDVKWDLLYRWYEPGDAIPGWTTLENTVDVSARTADTHYEDDWTGISGAAIANVRSILEFRIQRDTADAADDHEQDVLLKVFDVHYQIDQPGAWSQDGKWA